ncbi:MAG: DUF2844 domain-containing protein [Proteobacteria bacterium]|nr:DUF2844 domain-containing protein [Pseudomonadota bacterium]
MASPRPIWFALLATCLSLPALAGLGDDASSVASDLVHMKGQLRVETTPAYTVHEITAANQTVIREYVSGAGKVFAVSWRSASPPDLATLLSKYYPQYAKAPPAGRPDKHHFSIEQPGLVVQTTGRTRAWFSRAWAPDLLPAGFSLADIT